MVAESPPVLEKQKELGGDHTITILYRTLQAELRVCDGNSRLARRDHSHLRLSSMNCLEGIRIGS